MTALRAARGDRVAVELDGEPWRTLPAAAVVAARLVVGGELDRGRARELARSRRRAEALRAAAKALARRDRPRASLAAALEQRGVRAGEREAALETVERLGYLDDARFARARAQALAERGWGDAAIRFELDRQGVESETLEAALTGLEAERERARTLVDRLGKGPKAARRLAAKGFSEESIEAALTDC